MKGMLGESREITGTEASTLEMLVLEAPVEVFSRLNRKLNTLGLAIMVTRLADFAVEDTAIPEVPDEAPGEPPKEE